MTKNNITQLFTCPCLTYEERTAMRAAFDYSEEDPDRVPQECCHPGCDASATDIEELWSEDEGRLGILSCERHELAARVILAARDARWPDVTLPSGIRLTIDPEPGPGSEDWDRFIARASEEELRIASIPLGRSWLRDYEFQMSKGPLTAAKQAEYHDQFRRVFPYWAANGRLPIMVHFYPFLAELV